MGGIKISLADKWFSTFIRTRDKWTCLRCFKTYEPSTSSIQCSHFWGRGMRSVRFDPENADALCYGCHARWESSKQGDYRDFKIKQLGQERYDALQRRAHIPMRVDEKLIVLWCKEMIKQIELIKENNSIIGFSPKR